MRRCGSDFPTSAASCSRSRCPPLARARLAVCCCSNRRAIGCSRCAASALTRLLNLTLLASGIAVLASLAFAAFLGVRLRRLQRAAETSLTHDGRLLNATIPDTGARDELGDVARSFATLLARLNEYTEYLRTLAGKLAHELRTPLAIVRSSLENLESEQRVAGPYLQRAREGTDRLQAILSAMGAASRTEAAIRHAERTRFDLAELVRSTTRAYGDTFATHRFSASVPEGSCDFSGAPDLIVQLLDKLVDNAVDFSAAGTFIEIALAETGRVLRSQRAERRQPLAEDVRARLFESMYQQRDDTPGKPHFGLGLYIVRLIAEFHGGRVFAESLPDRHAVRDRGANSVPCPDWSSESSGEFTDAISLTGQAARARHASKWFCDRGSTSEFNGLHVEAAVSRGSLSRRRRNSRTCSAKQLRAMASALLTFPESVRRRHRPART